ncbi:hypothetical protein [Geoglobus acetivorans]|uniref:Uncharacterized protein n=1 Tax=Geoglobus acetivorans TaxID=565033 RepID=A0A0A7GFH9_GEOAI|nr:hypothetical protein GACE_0650 [Geoglobus acetivorans]
MAKPLETRGAKLLALMLALIMLGSVLVYAFKGSKTLPEREIKYEVSGFKEILDLVSDSSRVIYLNFNLTDPGLVQLVDAYYKSLVSYDPLFRYNYIGLVSLNSMYYVEYPQTLPGNNPYVYLLDSGNYKVFFRHESKDEYMGVTVKLVKGYAMAENVNPVAVGTSDAVYKYIDRISGVTKVEDNYTAYIEKIPDLNYKFALVLFGDLANRSIRMNGSEGEVADFYFEGIALNDSGGYDKVVAINFKQNIFFVQSNVTEYYNVTRYGDLNIAFMHDTNFTRILEAKPEMRAVFIKPVETSGNES